MGYDGSLKFDTEINEKGFSSGLSKVGSLAQKGMAVATGAIAGCAASFGLITKASLDAVSSLEQNIGGIETLFKDNAQTVIENAQNAYKTAGLSANEYMSNVTSFSAALLQNLGGDTAKAAEMADMAMRDMSDNANKMGTDMETIIQTYQSLSRGNFAMLDNLKLGYGGTKAELQRLIQDAAKLDDSIDSNSMSYANVVKAIHAVQENMGITGTTAREAATTIEGSMNSAKAAWDNFLSGAGTTEELIDAVGVAAGVVGKNLAEIIPRLLETLPEAALGIAEQAKNVLSEIDFSGMANAGPQLAERLLSAAPEVGAAGLDLVTSLLENISANAGQIVSGGAGIIQNIIAGVQSAIPTLIPLAFNAVTSFAGALLENAPALMEAGVGLITTLGESILAAAQELFSESGLQTLLSFSESLRENAGALVDAGINIITSLAQGIAENLPLLIEYIPQIITNIAGIINDNAPKLLVAAGQIILTLAQGLISAIPTLIANIPSILQAIASAFMAFNWLGLGKNLITALTNGIKSMAGAARSAGQNILTNIEGAIKSLPQKLLTIGKNGVTGIANGVRGAVGTARSAAIGVMNSIVSSITALPGKLLTIGKNAVAKIKSAFTSGNWASVGKNIIDGIIGGVTGAATALYNKVREIASNALNAIESKLGINSPSRVFRDQVGKQIVSGIIAGLEAMEKGLIKTSEKISLSAIAAARNALAEGRLEDAGKELISSLTDGVEKQSAKTKKRLQALVDNQIKEVTDKKKYKKYKDRFSEIGKSLTDAMSDALSKSTTKITEQAQAKIEALSQSYQEAYDEVTKKQSDMLSKLTDVSDLYNLDDQIDQITRYQNGLNNLKGRIPESLMDELLGLNVGEAVDFAEYLNGLTDEQLAAYVGKWEKIQSMSKSYSDAFFKDELSTIKNSYSREVDAVMADAKAQMAKAGEDVAKGLIYGMKSQTKNLSKAAKKLAKQLIKDFKKELKIKSPSKVMDEEIGQFLPPGIAQGFMKALPKAEKAISGGVEKAVRAVQSRLARLQYPAPSAVISGAYPAPQITVVNDQPAVLQAEIHTTVDMDGRTVGKVITPYVNQNMSDQAKREERGS